MKTKRYPEYSEKYPAIDGIAKGERPSKEERERIMAEDYSKAIDGISYLHSERAIRSDIERILGLSDEDFGVWYMERISATTNLLEMYELFASIPDLQYGSENQPYDMATSSHLGEHIKLLKRSIEYIEVIRDVKEEQMD